MANNASGVLWRRLRYLLTPQFDLYKHMKPYVMDERVIEIGFGTGAHMAILAQWAAHIDAYEIDRDAVEHASEVEPHERVAYHTGDIASPTFYAPNIYGICICVEVLEHVKDQQQAIANIANCLRADGKAIISGPNANADLRKNDIHEKEWVAQEFYSELGPHFTSVTLFDYTLTEIQDETSTLTPLIAVCEK